MDETQLLHIMQSSLTPIETNKFGQTYADTFGVGAYERLFRMEPIPRALLLFQNTLSAKTGRREFWNWVRLRDKVYVYEAMPSRDAVSTYDVTIMPASDETYERLTYRLFTLFIVAFTVFPIPGSESYNNDDFMHRYWNKIVPGLPRVFVSGQEIRQYEDWMHELKELVQNNIPTAIDFGRVDIVVSIAKPSEGDTFVVWMCTACGKSWPDKNTCQRHEKTSCRRKKKGLRFARYTRHPVVGRRVKYTTKSTTIMTTAATSPN